MERGTSCERLIYVPFWWIVHLKSCDFPENRLSYKMFFSDWGFSGNVLENSSETAACKWRAEYLEEAHSETCQKSSMELFANITHKIYFRCMAGFWIRFWLLWKFWGISKTALVTGSVYGNIGCWFTSNRWFTS